MNELFSKLEAISKDGASVIVKIDGERWSDEPSRPFTVLIFGGPLTNETSFRIDSDNLKEAIEEGIAYYKNNFN
ncbi:hypothetical protein EKN56_03215 [Limnobaculum zhutongyuii]|uniref:Uncharacterized protein n=1 Tax=Limnobaculum zhutongyuii TaxID=2498113 RepID=A0A411WH04_9GAMM|nr:hypothetical protein [Limnobaculum zhutongyuii]QBH95502.1 hypothetical protein EKN56_03215 [Limnobaculum zhutongyuii]TQS88809.1 hypothetical protein ELQ32_09380 [Limnobaculum zhutongyuii]